ncbi:hypothetical protein PVAP13_2KG139316 [Panicum virgatum]|uniref:Uncharacterized protein n=1 Tax=Panicum virgatum TaxID=38727 RepID=A0A8T0W0S6_PANVG|nr:hypothetical protein PVAP13_2KG139316 [Panicum virgatum]
MPHEHPQEGPIMVTTFCPCHGRSSYPFGGDGSSSLEYTPATPLNSLATPLELLLRGMIAARCGALFFSMTSGSSSSIASATPPPLPPLASSTVSCPTATTAANARPGPHPTATAAVNVRPGPHPTAAAAANARPGLRHRIIKTGHVPAEMSASSAA